MIRVAICNDNDFSRKQDELIIRDLLPEFEIYTISDYKELNIVDEYDAYILSIDKNNFNDITSFGKHLYDEGIELIIYITSEELNLEKLFSSHPFDVIVRPDYSEKLLSLRQRLYKVFGIKTTEGIYKVVDKEILYVNKQGRIAQYHLTDGTILSSHSLRKSFGDCVQDILHNTNFVLLGTSLLVNKTYVSMIGKDYVKLINSEIIYPPKDCMRHMINYFPWIGES